MTTSYFILDNGQSKGPYSPDDLRQAELPPDTLVWREGLTTWIPVRTLPEWAVSQSMPAASSRRPMRFLFGSLAADWQAAAWASLGTASLYFFNDAVPLNQVLYNLLRIGPLAIYLWGLFQIGRSFNLKGLRQAARWLFVNELLIMLGIGDSGWLLGLIAAVTLLIRVKLMVDLWVLRSVLLTPLVMTLVATQVLNLIDDSLQLTNFYTNGLVYMINRVCMALLFYGLVDYAKAYYGTPPQAPLQPVPAA